MSGRLPVPGHASARDRGAHRNERRSFARGRRPRGALVHEHPVLPHFRPGLAGDICVRRAAPDATEGLDWVARGATLAELSQQLGIPAVELEAIVARFNAHARCGEDLDFGRHPDSLGLVEKPPFYGVELVTPDPYRATITIVVNRRAQVLHHVTQQPILGLYARGNMVATDRRLGVEYQAGAS